MSAMVDSVGMRFGAGLSAVVLVAGFVLGDTGAIVIPVVAVALGIGSMFGPARSPMSLLFKALRPIAFSRFAPAPEPASPPRFAQTIGFAFLGAASAFAAAGSMGVAWALVLIVAALQTLLAVTGICVGCEMYIVMKKLGARGA